MTPDQVERVVDDVLVPVVVPASADGRAPLRTEARVG
jgi:hypothetical protein